MYDSHRTLLAAQKGLESPPPASYATAYDTTPYETFVLRSGWEECVRNDLFCVEWNELKTLPINPPTF